MTDNVTPAVRSRMMSAIRAFDTAPEWSWSWLPLYDRNPQTFVPNIMFASPADYVKVTQRVYRGGATTTHIELPILSAS